MDTGLSVDEIYQILEGEIVSLEIKPGEMLSENTLCNVSPYPVPRSAVRCSVWSRTVLCRLFRIKGPLSRPSTCTLPTS